MKHPTLNDFQQALQEPDQNFGDLSLRTAKVLCDAADMPVMSENNSVAVFCVEDSEGTQWLLRCFKSFEAGCLQQYSSIKEYLPNMQYHVLKPQFLYLAPLTRRCPAFAIRLDSAKAGPGHRQHRKRPRRAGATRRHLLLPRHGAKPVLVQHAAQLARLLASRKEQVESRCVKRSVRAEIAREFGRYNNSAPIFFPEHANDMPNQPALTLVVLPPERSFQERDAL